MMGAETKTKAPAEPWLVMNPDVRVNSRAFKQFRGLVAQLAAPTCTGDVLNNLRASALKDADLCGEERGKVRVLVSILCDLRGKDWRFRIKDKAAEVAPPEEGGGTILEQKERVRSSLVLERDAQLRGTAVRAFIKEMEQRRYGKQGWTSIFSVMRDGRDLAKQLRDARAVPDGPERHARLREVIDPYLQFASGEELCELTELKRGEIWRYFRHTWATPYTNSPGRKFWILVRDRAVKYHPVIGIAAFGNAVVQLTTRDEWIGWTAKQFLDTLKNEASKDWAAWLKKSVKEMEEAVYVNDFLEERVISRKELNNPDDAVIRRLDELAEKERKLHDREPQSELHKVDDDTNEHTDWLSRAKTHLFRAKRAEALGRVLQVRKALKKVGFTDATKEKLLKVLEDAAGRRAVEIVLRGVKGTRVGINLMEITVCGAVAPYNALLGGKLVAMLLTSPEVVAEYERRYCNAVSVIASSTAGEPITRKPNLVALGTSSLYGVGSAMYNRISIPCEACGGHKGDVIEYKDLGKSVGFGSIQFSPATINEIEAVLESLPEGRQINHIFGEGQSPRLRKVRAGMEAVGLPPDSLLKHGTQRIVYGVALAEQFREVLTGRRTNRPRYFLPGGAVETTRMIGDFWIRRWLSKRIESAEVLAGVEKHTLVYPVEHGAKVVLPPVEPDGPNLFSALEGSA